MHAGGLVHSLTASLTPRSQRAALRKAMPHSWLPDDASREFARLLARYMTSAAIIGTEYGQALLTTDVLPGQGFLSEKVTEFIASYTGTFADQWVQDQADAISSAVLAGMQAGDSMDGIATRIGDVFDGEMGDAKALTIARTETIRASNEGALDRYAEAGVTEKEWSADGEGTCEVCDGLDGQQISLEDDFVTDDGAVSGPPAHPNCRCSVLPVLKEFGAAGGDLSQVENEG
jgi:SPP1 gp7 family putative phage head morphogenesis protein